MYLSGSSERPTLGTLEVGLRLAVVTASMAGAAVADAAPTGTPGIDVFWRALIAVVVTSAALLAGPVARLVPALVATAVAAATESWTEAAVGCAILTGAVLAPQRGPRGPLCTAALVGAGLQLLFRMPDLEPSRTTTVLGCLACLPLLVSAPRALGARGRRAVRWGAAAGGVALVVAAAPFALAGALAWGDIGRGAGEANAWRVTTAAGDEAAAANHLQGAADAFAQADDRLEGWWMAPARLVPLVAQHAEAADIGLASGRRLVGSAQDILAVADPKDLRLTEGALDLELVADIRGPLGEGVGVLGSVQEALADLDTMWLLPTFQDDVRELTGQVVDARVDAEFADRVLQVVPDLLGLDGPRRYFVVFSTPAETRELGGILGNWGILTATDGRLDLERTGRAGDLNQLNLDRGVTLREPESYPVRYVQADPDEFWQNVTSSPDLPTVARAIADLHQQATDEPIDGVLVVDPVALAALLELTGPVDVPGLDEPLTTDTAADFLLREQYVRFPELGERVDFLADVADATFDRLTSGELPGPAGVAQVLGPMVDGRHLLFWTLDEAPQPLLTELGLDGALPPVDGDVLAVARGNGLPNKLDAYLREELAYDVEVDAASGLVQATLTATYTNEAPPDLPAYVAAGGGTPPGTSQVLVSVWTPFLSAGATVDGRPEPLERQVELGRNRYLTFLTVPPGASVTLTLALEGPIPAGGYRLTVVRQPLSSPSPLAVDIVGADGRALPDLPETTVVGG